MFWDSSIEAVNTINPLLESEDVTLEQVLSDSSCFQEFYSKNDKLLTYLKNNFSEMLGYITNNPGEELSPEHTKIATTVFEMLSCSLTSVLDEVFFENDQYFKQLWSILTVKTEEGTQTDTDSSDKSVSFTPLDPLKASYFTKIFMNLFQKRYATMLDYLWDLKAPNDFVSCVLRHINTSAIMDLVINSWEFLMLAKQQAVNAQNKFNQILLDNQLIERSINCFVDPSQGEKQENVEIMLTKFIFISRELMMFQQDSEINCILEKIEKEQFSLSLMESIFTSKGKSSLRCGLRIFQALLGRGISSDKIGLNASSSLNILNDLDESESSKAATPSEIDPSTSYMVELESSTPVNPLRKHLFRTNKVVAQVVCSRIEDFVNFLKNPPFVGPMTLTTGELKVPLGVVRLEIVHLFACLFACSDKIFIEKCLELNIPKLLTDLFFEFKFNSQLHSSYSQVVRFLFQNSKVFHSTMDKIQSDLEANPEQPKLKEKLATIQHVCSVFEQLEKQLITDCGLRAKILDAYQEEKLPQPPTLSAQVNLNATYDANSSLQNTKTEESMEEDGEEKQEEGNNPDEKDQPEEMETEVEPTETADVEMKSESEASPVEPLSNKKVRPAFMGHLRDIANILCEENIEKQIENVPVEESWEDFKFGKLRSINELFETKLCKVNTIKNDEILQMYEKPSFIGIIPVMPPPIPNRTVHDISELEHFGRREELDRFDEFFDNMDVTGNLEDFEKVFNLRSSSIFEDEDFTFSPEQAPNPKEEIEKSLLKAQELFPEETQHGDTLNTTDPWNDSNNSDNSKLNNSSESWCADFSNDPFASTSRTADDSEFKADFSETSPTKDVSDSVESKESFVKEEVDKEPDDNDAVQDSKSDEQVVADVKEELPQTAQSQEVVVTPSEGEKSQESEKTVSSTQE